MSGPKASASALVAATAIITGCAGSAGEASGTANDGSSASQPATAAAPSASSASGLLRLCEAFDIVTGTVSPAYESIAADTSDLNVQMQGLTIMVAGSDIADLARGVGEPEFADILEHMGQGYIDEGEAVTEGDIGSTDATTYYLDQVVEYGQECP